MRGARCLPCGKKAEQLAEPTLKAVSALKVGFSSALLLPLPFQAAHGGAGRVWDWGQQSCGLPTSTHKWSGGEECLENNFICCLFGFTYLKLKANSRLSPSVNRASYGKNNRENVAPAHKVRGYVVFN